MKKFGFAALLAATTALVAVDAHAAFIKGDITMTGGLKGAGLGSGPMVSSLSTIPVSGSVLVTGTGGLVNNYLPVEGSAGAISSFTIPIPGNPAVPVWITVSDGGPTTFNFNLQAASAILAGSGFSCSTESDSCTDSASFTVSGAVTGAGFESSSFTGSFAMTSTCADADNNSLCDGTPVGSFTVSLSSTGEAPPPPPPPPPSDVPVPATLALLGAGLVGLGVSRRRRA